METHYDDYDQLFDDCHEAISDARAALLKAARLLKHFEDGEKTPIVSNKAMDAYNLIC